MSTDWQQNRKSLISRLKRIEGQLRGIQRMMEEEQDCERVAQQLAAARKALDKTFFEAMACAMRKELGKGSEGAVLDQQISHLTALLSKYG